MKEDKYIYLKLKLLECKDAIESLGKALTNIETELIKLKTEITPEEQVTRFEPKLYEYYSYVGVEGHVYYNNYTGANIDKLRVSYNNCFRRKSSKNLTRYTHDVIRVQNRLMQLHEELCPEFWGETSTYEIFFGLNNWDCFSKTKTKNGEVYGYIPFTYSAAKKACEILNEEKFMLEENDESSCSL